MALIIRDSSPTGAPIRPDQVYATGVLSPMSGFQPPTSAQRVMQAFTSGLGSPTLMGPIRRLGLRIRAALAMRRARAFSNLAGGNVEALQAQRCAPQLAQKMATLSRITSSPAGTSGAMVSRSNIFGSRY